jgi:hypothetical protein
MSINFDDPMNEEARALVKKLFDEPVAQDEHTVLLDSIPTMFQKQMKELANAAKQPVSAEINSVGDTKPMDDGTIYKLTSEGWKKA